MRYTDGMDDKSWQQFMDVLSGKKIEPLSPAEAIQEALIKKNRHALFRLELLEARFAKHVTQADLAAAIGTTQKVIAGAESRKGNPRLNTLLKMAEALGMRLTLAKSGVTDYN